MWWEPMRAAQWQKQNLVTEEDTSQRQPYPKTLTPPPFTSPIPHEQPVCNHVEDETSQSPWNTPFKVKVNFKGTVLDATLVMGVSLSAIRADLIPENIQSRLWNTTWSAPPLWLANPLGNWQTISFMGNQMFIVIPDLSFPLVLGIDFIGTSLVIHVPTRTVIVDDSPPFQNDIDDNTFDATVLERGTMVFSWCPTNSSLWQSGRSQLGGRWKSRAPKATWIYQDPWSPWLYLTSWKCHWHRRCKTGQPSPLPNFSA